jgi:hypothetical protein
MRRSVVVAFASVVFALSGCIPASSGTPGDNGPASPPPSTEPGIASPSTAAVSIEPTIAAPSSPAGPTLASGEALPVCTPTEPEPSDTVTFIASGNAWAMSPDGDHLTCLFPVENPGPFQWGPLGDRVLLGGLEVKGVADGPSRPVSELNVRAVTWSRPTGKSIVYAPADAKRLAKVVVTGSTTLNVTPPLGDLTYLSLSYHPSGEAIAFAVDQGGTQSIWIASNTGKKPGRLAFSEQGTTFGAIAFEADGKHLLYAAVLAKTHPLLFRIDITDTSKAPVVWSAPEGRTIADIRPGLENGSAAWTTETTCADSIAMAQLRNGDVFRVLPDGAGPNRAVGWLSTTHLLVSSGGCDGPLALASVDVSDGSVVPLVSGVSIAAVRTPVATPPAPLPKLTATEGSGFG